MMPKKILLLLTLSLLLAGCKQPAADEKINAVEDGRIDLGSDKVLDEGTRQTGFAVMLDDGLTYRDLVPDLDITMSPDGLFTAEMVYNPAAQWDDQRIRINVMFPVDSSIKGTGSITIYTKDGLSKGSIKITRN